ncbi:protein of unknown function [Nitrospina watsonii]|uniref:Uncharacterized protein n=1 Tax=Nitrospina watsonii TaxID=1323948 RepID=A0ABN8VY30_9BACT|nr:protein of unknown function [Nitrospina watsonii]
MKQYERSDCVTEHANESFHLHITSYSKCGNLHASDNSRLLIQPESTCKNICLRDLG